jgi:ABC-type antimicrobial peptide transport system permease subunit
MMILAGAVLILGLCGFFAGLIPALRAAAVDPMRALRTE